MQDLDRQDVISFQDKLKEQKMDKIQKDLLEQVADLHGIPEGAYNIRANGESLSRNTTENIDIITKTDKNGIDIRIKDGTLQRLDELSKNIKVSPSSVGLLYIFLGRSLEKMRQDRKDPKAATWDRAVSYISANPNFQVKELATYCNMSESGIYAFFKQYGHTSPIELKNRILIKRAVDLLTTPDLSIEEICSRIGFCNAAYFRKQLRRVTGKTPHEIRRESERI